MNNRISTGMMYNQSVSLMLGKQAQLNQIEQQIATGRKLVTAKDDPVAAGSAVGLDRAVAALDRFEQNASVVENRLGLQENALQSAGELMSRVTELTVQANNPALSADDRKTIASELSSIHDSLLALANTKDGNGRYLFAGTADDSTAFSITNGVVTYNGDQTRRQVEVAPDTFVADALPGSELFMRLRTGDGTLDGSAATSNTGTGVLTSFGKDTGSGSWNGSAYTLTFTGTDTYDVRNDQGAVVSSGTYTAGQDITFEGLRMRVTGGPTTGDSFSLGASSTRDIFSTISGLVSALEMDTSDPAALAVQGNALQAGIRDVARAAEAMIDGRASGGAQLSALDAADSLRDANGVTMKATLSSMRDLDYAEVISKYKLESAALQAAQTVFSQIQSMSLFNMIR